MDTRAATRRAALTAVAALAAATAVAGPAQAVEAPAKPTGVRVSAATHSSFTVTMNKPTYATSYRLYASLTRSDVYVANIARARASAVSTTPTLTLGALPYAAAPYHYRVVVYNGTRRAWSDIYTTYLRPDAPGALAAATSTAGTNLTWTGTGATSYRVTQATDPALTQGRVTYTVDGRDRRFTPTGLAKGVPAYFRVQAANGTTLSAAPPPVSVVPAHSEQQLTAMTYNLLGATNDGQVSADGTVIAPWSQRRHAAAAVIRRADPDVVAVQEGASWIGLPEGRGGTRQVDDLVAALGGAYALARTETPPSERGYFRASRYVLYKPDVYALAGSGWHWHLGDGKYAAYQPLRHRATGAKVLFVSVHLITNGAEGAGAAGDLLRQKESQSLLAQAGRLAAALRTPVVYAGDFNSHEGSNHTFDGPGLAFRAARHSDAVQAAASVTDARYNTANGYVRAPKADGRHLDKVYGAPGVGFRSWRQWVDIGPDGRYAGTIASDHNAVSVVLGFPY